MKRYETNDTFRHMGYRLFKTLGSSFLLLLAVPAAAQTPDTLVVIGAHYRAGIAHRWLLGSEYRRLWSVPVRAPLLDLRTFGGGLTPTTVGGGRQTKSIRFRGNDGYEYGFRSIDKDPGVISEELEGTVVDRLVQDQISSSHPAAPAIAAVLMEATGVLHTPPQLVVLPDDPGLGEYRQDFAGVIGYLQRRAIVKEGVRPFGSALEIIESEDLFERVRRGPNDRVDARALLKARLLDVYMGDFDRHRGQWTWARFADDVVRHWVPLPEDRDQAFARYDGVALWLARLHQPELVNFGASYSGFFGLVWVGRELDRLFLSTLDKAVWDSVALHMQQMLSDSVLLAASAAMPPEMRQLDAGRLVQALQGRRDELPRIAARLYRLHAREAELHATDASERVVVERFANGTTAVTIMVSGTDATPYVERRYRADETGEIRLYLHGGADTIHLRGSFDGPRLRLVGGEGSDVVVDEGIGGSVTYYGSEDVLPGHIAVDGRHFETPIDPTARSPIHRDWGSRWLGTGMVTFSPDYGLLFTAGAEHTDYGFRHVPSAATIQFRGAFSSRQTSGRGSIAAVLRRSNSKLRTEIDALISRIEVIYFHGFGNERPAVQGKDFYRADQILYRLTNELVWPLTPGLEASVGLEFTRSRTRNRPGTLLTDSLTGLYGAGSFSQAGAAARLTLDTRDHPGAATRGVRFELGVRSFPKLLTVDVSPFTVVDAEAATYFTAQTAPLRPTLAVRAGGKAVFGTYPFYEAAFIGDASTTRLGRKNRYAGDAAAWASAELRLRLSHIDLILPGALGVFGLADVGRVFLEGESSATWHPVFGGGVWLSFLSPANTLTAAVAAGDERTAVYVQAGFAF